MSGKVQQLFNHSEDHPDHPSPRDIHRQHHADDPSPLRQAHRFSRYRHLHRNIKRWALWRCQGGAVLRVYLRRLSDKCTVTGPFDKDNGTYCDDQRNGAEAQGVNGCTQFSPELPEKSRVRG